MKYSFPVINEVDVFLKTNEFIKDYSKYRDIAPEDLDIYIIENKYEEELIEAIQNKLEEYIYKGKIRYTIHETFFQNIVCSKIESDIFPEKGFFVGLIKEKAEKSKIKEILRHLTHLILERQLSVKGSFIEDALGVYLNDTEKKIYYYIEATDYFYED